MSMPDGSGAGPRLVLRQMQANPTAVLICLAGELDCDTTVLLREAVAQVAARRHDQRRLLLDLSALTYCDGAGLFTLLGICQALDMVGISVAIPWTGPVADAAIALAGLQDRLPLRSSRQRAHPSWGPSWMQIGLANGPFSQWPTRG